MVGIQSNNSVTWVHQDPVNKSQRLTNASGTVTSTIELDPWGADTNRSNNAAFQPKKFTSYERDGNGGDEAMFRRYNRAHSRFDQPDPYDGSYSLTNPQGFNRYAYVNNDPVNFVDPSGLEPCRDVDGNIIDCGPDTIDDKVISYTWEEYWLDLPWNRFTDEPIFRLPVIRYPFRNLPQNPAPPQTPAPPQNPEPTPPGDPCVTSPYVNFSIGGGNLVAGGSISILASNRGIYLQLGYGSVFQANLSNAPRTSRFARFSKLGPSPTIRFSRSGITDGWGSTTDFTYFAQNYDEDGNPTGKEFGYVGLPSASGQTTYTTRLWNVNGCN